MPGGQAAGRSAAGPYQRPAHSPTGSVAALCSRCREVQARGPLREESPSTGLRCEARVLV